MKTKHAALLLAALERNLIMFEVVSDRPRTPSKTEDELMAELKLDEDARSWEEEGNDQ